MVILNQRTKGKKMDKYDLALYALAVPGIVVAFVFALLGY